MGSENSKPNDVDTQLFTKGEKIKKTVTISDDLITFQDSGYFETFKDSENKKPHDNLAEFLPTSKTSSEASQSIQSSNNPPILKSILKPSKYPPLVDLSFFEQANSENDNLEKTDKEQKISINNPIPILANSGPTFIKKNEPLFIRKSEPAIVANDEKLVVPIRKVISNPSLPIARPVIITQQAIPYDWLESQTKIIPIKKSILPTKIVQAQDLNSSNTDDSNEWKKYFRNNKLNDTKKVPSKNFGFQNQNSDQIFLLSKKVRTVDLKKSASFSTFPVIQPSIPKFVISNRGPQLKLNEENKRKK
jgi:hypothetical protein